MPPTSDIVSAGSLILEFLALGLFLTLFAQAFLIVFQLHPGPPRHVERTPDC